MRPILTELGRCICAGIAAALIAAPGAALAQAYPAKPIRMIVPFAPGSTADIAARFAAQELSKALGQSVFVENKPGAGGTIGTAELARAAPDGYTIGQVSQTTLVFAHGIYAKPGYDSLKDFAPIAMFGRTANVMVVHPSNPASAPAHIVAVAKSKPGWVTFSSAGSGSSQHVAGVLFGRAIGADLVHVPYKGAAQGMLAVMTNEVTMGFFNMPLVIGPIKEGKLKALGVTSLERSSLLPNVPTLDELGLKGYEVNAWGGYVAPAGTPPEIVARLNVELVRISRSENAMQARISQGFELVPPLTPAEFGNLIANDLAHWVPLVRMSGARAD